jgi:hypothetical protein
MQQNVFQELWQEASKAVYGQWHWRIKTIECRGQLTKLIADKLENW